MRRRQAVTAAKPQEGQGYEQGHQIISTAAPAGPDISLANPREA
jgi:hypothetical protein